MQNLPRATELAEAKAREASDKEQDTRPGTQALRMGAEKSQEGLG